MCQEAIDKFRAYSSWMLNGRAFADNAWRSEDLPCTWHAVLDPDEVAVFDLDLSITLSLQNSNRKMWHTDMP